MFERFYRCDWSDIEINLRLAFARPGFLTNFLNFFVEATSDKSIAPFLEQCFECLVYRILSISNTL